MAFFRRILLTVVSTLLAASGFAENLVPNSGFDTGTPGWSLAPTSSWNALDANGSPLSGSLRGENNSTTANSGAESGRICVPIAPSRIHLGGKLYMPMGQATSGDASFGLVWSDHPTCNTFIGFLEGTSGLFSHGTWEVRERTFTRPEGAIALSFSAWVGKVETTGTHVAHFDDVFVLGPPRGDGNGDLSADLLWRNDGSGANVIWYITGTEIAASATLPTVADPNWRIAALADFQGDGKADVFWRHATTGANVIWLMDGGTVAASAMLPSVPDPDWTIAGSGDFQGDGKADLFWRHISTGADSLWLMNGMTVAVSAGISAVPPPWTPAAFGDINGDGKSDVVWRNAETGHNSVWLMNGAKIGTARPLPLVSDTNWQIAGAGDLQGDVKADLVWRNAVTGANVAWLMNGATVAVSALLPDVPDPGWTIARISDFQADRKADIFWRHSASGATVQWLMDGTTVALGTPFPAVSAVSWKISGKP